MAQLKVPSELRVGSQMLLQCAAHPAVQRQYSAVVMCSGPRVRLRIQVLAPLVTL